jgi:hypothetical protein
VTPHNIHQVWVSILQVIRASSRSRDGGLKKPTKPKERGRREDNHTKAGAEPAIHSGSSLACSEGGYVI